MSLTEHHIEDLEWSGITPPPHGYRTTCPKCSPTRRKSRERCLKVTIIDWGMEVECFHCGYSDAIVSAYGIPTPLGV